MTFNQFNALYLMLRAIYNTLMYPDARQESADFQLNSSDAYHKVLKDSGQLTDE